MHWSTSLLSVATMSVMMAGHGPTAAQGVEGSTPAVPTAVVAPDVAFSCDRVAPHPWPATAGQRAAQIQHLESLRSRCIDSPAFLAMLGGLLLESGNAEQALIWLERSLLLDPGNLGAQADHALALAELGEGIALQQLASAWALRADIPPALRARLRQVQASQPNAVRLGRSGLPQWGLQREISILSGYENNLDQSPRLNELTLTAPDGNVVLPVSSRPRRGAGLTSSASLQGAYSPEPGTVWRTGLTASARNTPAQRQTDWSYIQWAASGVQHWTWLRTHVDFGASWIGGPLNEPYRLLRAGFGADVAARSCRVRLGVDVEQRRQSSTTSFDASGVGLQLGLQCPWVSAPGAVWSLYVRSAKDRPDDEGRPGGQQQQAAVGARMSMPLGPRWQMDVSFRASRVRDELGYSELLENNAARRLNQVLLSAEWTHRADPSFLAGAQAVLQVHAVRQASNLRLFEYRSLSVHSGLRWNW